MKPINNIEELQEEIADFIETLGTVDDEWYCTEQELAGDILERFVVYLKPALLTEIEILKIRIAELDKQVKEKE